MKLNEEWTVEIVGRLHKYRITKAELAKACGYTVPYISLVLNGAKEFSSEKSKERTKRHIFAALKRLEALREIIKE